MKEEKKKSRKKSIQREENDLQIEEVNLEEMLEKKKNAESQVGGKRAKNVRKREERRKERQEKNENKNESDSCHSIYSTFSR